MAFLSSGSTPADFKADGNIPQSNDKFTILVTVRKIPEVGIGSLSQVALDNDSIYLETSSSDNGVNEQSDAIMACSNIGTGTSDISFELCSITKSILTIRNTCTGKYIYIYIYIYEDLRKLSACRQKPGSLVCLSLCLVRQDSLN